MSEFIIVITFLSELLAICICLYAFFCEKIVLDIGFCGTILVSGALLYCVNTYILPRVFVLLLYVFLWCRCFLRFKQSVWITTKKFFMGITLCVLIEAAVSWVSIYLYGIIDEKILGLLGSFVLLILVSIIGSKIANNVNLLDYRNDYKIRYAMLFYMAIEVIIIVDYHFASIQLSIAMISALLCSFVGYFYIRQLVKTKVEVEKKNLEMDLHKMYGDTYLELTSNIRKRQHDFKNQLGAIYSTHLTAKTMEELIALQREYGDALLEDCRYDAILTNCEHPIMAGYLYQRCLNCENRGIRVEYEVKIERAECVCSLHELIEVLGILLDNAMESFAESRTKQRVIRLTMQEKEDEVLISVANPAKKMTCAEIEELFTDGVSTKGKNRGIGLARLQELAKQYNTAVIVDTFGEENYNWLRFKIRFVKK